MNSIAFNTIYVINFSYRRILILHKPRDNPSRFRLHIKFITAKVIHVYRSCLENILNMHSKEGSFSVYLQYIFVYIFKLTFMRSRITSQK